MTLTKIQKLRQNIGVVKTAQESLMELWLNSDEEVEHLLKGVEKLHEQMHQKLLKAETELYNELKILLH